MPPLEKQTGASRRQPATHARRAIFDWKFAGDLRLTFIAGASLLETPGYFCR
jgi:hypothetical protein